MSEVFDTLVIAEKGDAAKVYLAIREKFYDTAVEALGQKTVDILETIAGTPRKEGRKAAWDEYFSTVEENRTRVEYFYGAFRRAHRSEYAEHGGLTVYTVDAKGNVVKA